MKWISRAEQTRFVDRDAAGVVGHETEMVHCDEFDEWDAGAGVGIDDADAGVNGLGGGLDGCFLRESGRRKSQR